MGEVVSLLRNGSLFSDSRMVLLKNAELIKKKEDIELLTEYMASPQDDTVLVLISDETSMDKRLEGAVGGEGKRIFWELFENRKSEWVSSFFKREGFRISEGAVDSILELVENNTDALRRECSRLILFLDKEGMVTEEAVERCLSHTREESAFTLFSRIAEGDTGRALETLRTLLASKESPQAILAGLTWSFRKLTDYLRLTAEGRLNDFELRKIGAASKKAQKDYSQASRRYDGAKAGRAVALLAECDILLRSYGAAAEELILDLLILKLTAMPGSSLERIS